MRPKKREIYVNFRNLKDTVLVFQFLACQYRYQLLVWLIVKG